jgi:tetratricopeptide (TPR) repeat protein
MRRERLAGLVLFIVTFTVFSRVLVADFVQWDDNISVYENPHIQGLDFERLAWMFTDASYAMRYKPLTWLCYALLYHFVGLKPLAYHLTGLVLHCVNSVVLFVILQRLLTAAAGSRKETPPVTACDTVLPAGFGALIWAVNPLRVEPVARVTDLTYCLLLCFTLVSLWFYLEACRPNTERARHCLYYGFSIGAFAIAMLSYPFAFGYAFVLLALDWYPLRRFEGTKHLWQDPRARQILLEKVPFLLLGGLMFTTVLARLNATGIWAAHPAALGAEPFGQGMQALYVWTYYLWKPWVPLHLSPVYTALVNFNPDNWVFWTSAVVVVGLTLLVLHKRTRWPLALVLWVAHLALLLPALGLTERPHYTSDRYDYLAGLVWAALIAALLWKISTRGPLRAAGVTVVTAVVVVWGTLSFQQTAVWRDSASLFTYMIRELGSDPYRSDIHWRLGWYYATKGKTNDAMQEYQAALRIQPAEGAYIALGELLEKTGDYGGALTNFQALLELRPNPYDNVRAAQVLSKLGHSDEAARQYRIALALLPDLVPALNNLAWILATDENPAVRDGAEAVRLAERACALAPQTPVLLGTLAAADAEAGRFEEAVEKAKRARDLAQAIGDNALALKNQKLLELYQAHQPYREPANAASQTR